MGQISCSRYVFLIVKFSSVTPKTFDFWLFLRKSKKRVGREEGKGIGMKERDQTYFI